jgi:hypothetical protein
VRPRSGRGTDIGASRPSPRPAGLHVSRLDPSCPRCAGAARAIPRRVDGRGLICTQVSWARRRWSSRRCRDPAGTAFPEPAVGVAATENVERYVALDARIALCVLAEATVENVAELAGRTVFASVAVREIAREVLHCAGTLFAWPRAIRIERQTRGNVVAGRTVAARAARLGADAALCATADDRSRRGHHLSGVDPLDRTRVVPGCGIGREHRSAIRDRLGDHRRVAATAAEEQTRQDHDAHGLPPHAAQFNSRTKR